MALAEGWATAAVRERRLKRAEVERVDVDLEGLLEKGSTCVICILCGLGSGILRGGGGFGCSRVFSLSVVLRLAVAAYTSLAEGRKTTTTELFVAPGSLRT